MACAIVGATLLTFLFDWSAPRAARICFGACLGLPLLATIGFLVSLWLGLGPASIAISAMVTLLPLLLLLSAEHRARIFSQFTRSVGSLRGNLSYPLFYIAISILLGLVFSRAVFVRPDGIFTGIANNLGDLPLHLQIINSFAQGHNLPPQDPTYAGVRFAYPFLVDFLAAMLVRAGAGIIAAIWLQNMLMGLTLVGSLHYFTLQLTRNRRAGFIAPLLVIFSGGLGWWLLFSDASSANGIFSLLGNLPHDYTILSEPNSLLRWGNSLTTLFVPQRSILFGLPLAIFVFCQWWIAVVQKEPDSVASGAPPPQATTSSPLARRTRAKAERNKTRSSAAIIAEAPAFSRYRMIAAGVAAGLLPLVHAHTFLVVMASAACLALVFRSGLKSWLLFFAVAIPISLPEILWLANTGGVNARSYLGWQPGWDHSTHNILWFWIANTGLFIPVLLAALFWRRGDLALPRRLLRFYTPFAFCFIIPNLVKLAPWVWDNIKVLFLWYLASTPLVALFLARVWAQKSFWRWLAPVALASMLLAGGLDVLRVISAVTEYQEFDPPGIAVAKTISADAAPNAVVLHAPTYNSPVFLTGRRSLLGYPGWMWSRGLDYSPRNADIQRIYSGGPDAPALLRRYGIDYVLIGPTELASFNVNAQFWSQYKLQAQAGPYRLYKIQTVK
ncbi:MAG TPA: hypothetical protein VIB39_13730 [Candidatus Angelobacter sp.]